MHKARIVVVEDHADLRKMIVEYLLTRENIEFIREADNGKDAVDIVRQEPIDVVVTDLVMPKMDGFSLIERLRETQPEHPPRVIIVTALSRDDFVIQAIAVGAAYFMLKPVDLEQLYARIMDAVRTEGMPPLSLNRPLMLPPAAGQTPDERIGGLFLTLGIPAHIKGYTFLREAVKMVVDCPDMINRITKELYPTVARRYNTTSSKVERAIRHAIEVAWNRGRIDTLNQAFGCEVALQEAKPTNGEFIAMIADRFGASGGGFATGVSQNVGGSRRAASF